MSVMTQTLEINCLGMKCPRPIIEIAKAARKLPPGSVLQIRADDLAFESDVKAWAENAEASILRLEKNGQAVLAELQLKKD
jgi:tRNA 2-thiouridine synthesizing protein A